MFARLACGGHLIMTFPYNETRYVRNVYELPGSSYGAKTFHTSRNRFQGRRSMDGSGRTAESSSIRSTGSSGTVTIGQLAHK
jgi:hypothetical protein